MRHRSLRLLLACLTALALGSCSYGYDLLVAVIHGRLAFVVDPSSDYKPDCIDMIDVSVDKGGPIAQPAAGDNNGLVRNGGVYWWKSFEIGSCQNTFPIFYGQRLTGPPFLYDDGPSGVEAKPLRVGVVYQVNTSGDGASASAWFRINKDGRVENLPDDPTPPVVNEQGYDVTDYANTAQAPELGTYDP